MAQTVKSMAGWKESGVATFDKYCFVGDEVTVDIVYYFANSVPPIVYTHDYVQAGELYNFELDSVSGRYKPTYTTFYHNDGKWIFAGYCFKGETVNRVVLETRTRRNHYNDKK